MPHPTWHTHQRQLFRFIERQVNLKPVIYCRCRRHDRLWLLRTISAVGIRTRSEYFSVGKKLFQCKKLLNLGVSILSVNCLAQRRQRFLKPP